MSSPLVPLHEVPWITKRCSTCRQVKPVEDFYLISSRIQSVNSRSYGRFPYCTSCTILYSQNYRAKNGDSPRKLARARERMREWSRTHSVQHHDSCLRGVQRRKTITLGLPYEDLSRTGIYFRDKGVCHICKQNVEIGEPRWAIDHLVPYKARVPEWFLHPGHTYHNVALSHGLCNTAKSNKLRPADLWFMLSLLACRNDEDLAQIQRRNGSEDLETMRGMVLRLSV